MIINFEAARGLIEQALAHYGNAPAWFENWLNDLYIRLGEDWAGITLDEMVTLQNLKRDDEWKPEPLAVNNVYKLFDRLGRDTSGILGY